MMNVLFITILFLVIIICIFTVFFILIYNNFQDSIIRINEVEGKIDECLRKKYDLLNRSVTIVKGNIKIKSEVFDEVVRLRSRKINNFDLERKLVNGYQELLKVKSENVFEFQEGTLYPILHKLEEKKWISSYWDEVAGKKRKYYAITTDGKKYLDAKKEEWKTNCLYWN